MPNQEKPTHERLGLDDKDVQNYLKRNPEKAKELGEQLIVVEKEKGKNKGLESLKSLSSHTTSRGWSSYVQNKHFGFNKYPVAIAVTLIILLFLLLFLYAYIFYY